MLKELALIPSFEVRMISSSILINTSGFAHPAFKRIQQLTWTALLREHLKRKHDHDKPASAVVLEAVPFNLNKECKYVLDNRSKRGSDVEKWQRIYQLQFPHKELPSPCTFLIYPCFSHHISFYPYSLLS